ncbi:MAG: N-acetylmuramoyl-L-alanine amidase family protein [Atribacter sp.]|jgi:N-acetylmuramoyl-L-alanine amidase|uniref:N-acetylmuramoyl-L-alanine amidase n=1 Tax=Candidatus Atribacter allofermentans TaxID=1852833 RepID=A0A1V5SJ28_9BACT|nr:MAG: N-acetylmuramoyl-L-alanine amidase AmiC precursor [Candidatus Atribacteria bacterium ADurb.Bin276]
MSRHSNSLYIWLLLLLFCLVFSQPIYSKINIEYQGQVFSLDLPTIKVNGDNYISVENLFKQIGGVEYYSPIMKKVNLFFGGKNWVLSLDKGIAVAESGEEIPLGRSVVIQENSVYISPQFLNQLFGISTDTSSTVVTPSPSPTKTPSTISPVTLPTGSSSLLNVRSHSYGDENRSRVTFDFGINLPTHSMQTDQANNRIILTFNNATLAPGTPETFSLNDNRVDRVVLNKKGSNVEAIIYLKSPASIQKNQLGGENPRIYLDIVTSTLLTSPDVTILPASPSPPTQPTTTPALTSTPTPVVPTPTTKPPVQPTTATPYDKINPRVIVIDPGHGGKDPGCVVNGYQEKDIILQVSKKLKEALTQQGYEVYLTREGDTYPGLKERSAVANNKQPVVLLSIHANAAPNKKATGVEVFVGSAQIHGEGAADVANRENQRFISEGYTEEQNGKINSTLLDSYYLGSRTVSMKLGSLIENNIVKETGQASRGLKEAPLILLKGMYFPSCLIEIGFLSNPTEAKNLANGAFQDKLVRGIVVGIKQFMSSSDLKKFLEE